MDTLAAVMIAGKAGVTENKAAAIRRAAYVCFAKHGYHGTTVDLVCAEAGISKGAFYWHYDSKLAVFISILDTWADEVARELEKQFSSALSSTDLYTDVAAALIREGHRVRAILPVWLEFIAQSGRSEEMRAAIAKFHDRIRTVIFNLIFPSLASRFSETEVRILTSTILSAFIGVVSQNIVDRDAADFDAHVEQVLGIIQRVFPDKRA